MTCTGQSHVEPAENDEPAWPDREVTGSSWRQPSQAKVGSPVRPIARREGWLALSAAVLAQARPTAFRISADLVRQQQSAACTAAACEHRAPSWWIVGVWHAPTSISTTKLVQLSCGSTASRPSGKPSISPCARLHRSHSASMGPAKCAEPGGTAISTKCAAA